MKKIFSVLLLVFSVVIVSGYIACPRNNYESVLNVTQFKKHNAELDSALEEFHQYSSFTGNETIKEVLLALNDYYTKDYNMLDIEICKDHFSTIYNKYDELLDGNKMNFSEGSACLLHRDRALLFFDNYSRVIIDTNFEKGPNKVGFDIFGIIIDKSNYATHPARGEAADLFPADGNVIEMKSGDGTCTGSGSDYTGWGCSDYYWNN